MTTHTGRDRTISRPRTIKWGDVVVAAIALGIAAVLFTGAAAMDVRGQSVPGPQFFPVVVGLLLTAMGGFLAVRALIPAKRVDETGELPPDVSREMLVDVSHTNTQVIDLERAHGSAYTASTAQGAKKEAETDFDWRAVGITAAALVGFILLLPILGWIISCTLLFTAVTYAFGSKRIWFNLMVGLFIGALVQCIFSGLLGLSLPAGFIGGMF